MLACSAVSVEEHRRSSREGRFGFAVLTVSDSRDEASDRGGPLLAERLTAAGHRVLWRRIVRDELEAIRDAVREALSAAEIDALMVTGGTGISPRDRTIEAVKPHLQKELPGFGELFRQLSFAEIGPAAMLSRATAGIVEGRAVFLLPGSPAALTLALDRLILSEIGHLLSQARRRD